MTSTTLPVAPTGSARPTHSPGFTDLLRSEWSKFRTLRSTWWSLAAVLAVSLGVSITATAIFTSNYRSHGLDAENMKNFRDDTISLFLQPGSQFGQLAVGVLGVLVIASEFSTGMIRATMLAVPRRTSVILAKAAVLAGVVFLLSEVIAWACFFIDGAIVRDQVSVTLGTPHTLRALFGFGAVMAMTALISLSIGALLRHTAGAISIALGTILVLPALVSFVPGSAGMHLQYALPSQAGILIMDRTPPLDMPYAPWTGFGIIALWTVGLMLLALWSIKKRDV